MKLATAAFALAVMIASACAARPPAMAPGPAPASSLHYNSIEDFAASSGFSFLNALLNVSSFADAINELDAPVTLFAPTDAAFTQFFTAYRINPTYISYLDPTLVAMLLSYHTVPELVRVEDMTEGELLPTMLEGHNVTLHAPPASSRATSAFVVASEAKPYTANIIPRRYDIPAGANIIHVIDSVIVPPPELLDAQAVQGGQNGTVQAAG